MAENHPKISILVPVYNGEKYLTECLNSIAAQDTSDYEVLIGDDGSTDNSPQIIDDFVNKYPQFKKISKKGKGRGLFPNLNHLLTQVHAPLVRILCQDDVLLPQCLTQELKFMESNPNVAVAYSCAVIVDVDSKRVVESDLWTWPHVVRPSLSVQQFYFHGCLPGNLSTVCFRKSTIDSHGAFDLSFVVSADYELWSRICTKEMMGVISQRIVCLRKHGKQLSRSRKTIIPFLMEDTRIRAGLWSYLPREKRVEAAWYAIYFFGNARFKLLLDCLKKREPVLFFKAVFYLGPKLFFLDGLVWLCTFRGRFFRPVAPFVLTETEVEEHKACLAAKQA